MCLSIHLLASVRSLDVAQTRWRICDLSNEPFTWLLEPKHKRRRRVRWTIVSLAHRFPEREKTREKVRWIIWSSIEVHLVDALAAEGDEGRCSLR